MKRRHFLATALGSLALTPADRLLAALAADNRYRKEIGLQLWTVRDALKENVASTLKTVADAGYFQVEPFNSPLTAEIVAAAKDLGLKLNSFHFDASSIFEPKDEALTDFQKIVAQAKADGFTELVIPFLAPNYRSVEGYKSIAAKINKAAPIAKDAGLRLSYHNHAFEFKPLDGGTTGYDIFIAEFGPDSFFEVDTFWVAVGGHDPVAMIEKLDGRVSQLHLKDLKPGIETPLYDGIPEDAFQELGDGTIDWVKILAAAEKAGVTHCHVEQDRSPHPLKSIEQSINHLKTL